jgi:hypothetical protein
VIDMKHAAARVALRGALRVALGVALAAATMGCGAGEITKAALPDTDSAADAVGDPKCTADMIKKGGSPLVVDWDASKRSDLEVSMKQGVVVASYSCDKGVTVLPDCVVSGDYGYVGVSVKSEKISLTSADDIGANLSLGSAVPVGFKAALSRGSAVHLGYFLVGKRSAARAFVASEELSGSCDGATHFVRRADVGAFAMKSGAKADFSTALSVFSQGVSGGSKTEKEIDSKDGSPDACTGADPEAGAPPKECQAIIRVTLLPIESKPVAALAKEKPPEKVVVEPLCPEGFVLSDGKCQAKTAQLTTYLCAVDDKAECLAQCNAGDPGSCGRYADILMATGNDDWMEEVKPLQPKLADACDKADSASACAIAGWALDDRDAGLPFQIKGCRLGQHHACQEIADTLKLKDPQRYLSILNAACNGGSSEACVQLALRYLGRGDFAKDAPKARKLLERACDANHPFGCVLHGSLILTGDECKKAWGDGGESEYCAEADGSDPKKGREQIAKGCKLDERVCRFEKNLGG